MEGSMEEISSDFQWGGCCDQVLGSVWPNLSVCGTEDAAQRQETGLERKVRYRHGAPNILC